MASGTRKKYALDLNDIIAFPDAGHMPVFPPDENESWILLMEVRKFRRSFFCHWLRIVLSFQITADESLWRPVYAVKDVTQSRFIVALYTPDPKKDAESFRVGHTVCITSARPHLFLDGQHGFRIEDPSTIQVCASYFTPNIILGDA